MVISFFTLSIWCRVQKIWLNNVRLFFALTFTFCIIQFWNILHFRQLAQIIELPLVWYYQELLLIKSNCNKNWLKDFVIMNNYCSLLTSVHFTYRQ